jgi:hypothetical protein
VKNLKFTQGLFYSIILLVVLSCDAVEDVNICGATLTPTVVEVLDAVENSPIGKITMNASGGTPPYEYSIDGNNFVSSNVFYNLSGGSYIVTVMDADDCIAEETVTVSTQALVSYSKQIVPVIAANCTISGCHCDGNSLCFAEYETVKANALGIRDRTSARAMPPSYSGKSLTENEIKDIANWVYQGAVDN